MTREEQERILLLSYELDRRRHKESFYEFFKDAWKAVDPYTNLETNWHIQYLCFIAQQAVEDLLETKPAKHSTILINVPPRSLKSWIFNIALPVYVWTRNPAIPMITASYSLDLGLGFSRKSQQIIMSDWFQRRYSDIVKIGLSEGGREAVGETETSAGGIRFVASTESTVVGKGMLMGVVDDPLKPGEATQPKTLEKNIAFFNESIDTRRNNPRTSVIFVIMQRLAEGDLSGYLSSNFQDDPKFLHINLPAIQDGSEKVPYLEQFLQKYPEERVNVYKKGYLFGDRFDEAFIAKQKKKGTIFWFTQYMQNPLPSDGLVFRREWLTKISFDEYLKLERLNNLKRTFVCDTAYTDNTLRDATGVLTYATSGNTIYIINFTTDHIDSASLPKYIENVVRRNGYDERRSVVTIEPKGSGLTVVSLMKKLTDINVIPYKYPASAKVNINMSKILRAESVVPMVESGRVVLVEGSWNESFISQVVTFPLAKADEAVDCMVMAILRSHYIDQHYKKFALKRKLPTTP